MNLSKRQRAEIRMMFGGRYAYCGCELSTKWHIDHREPVVRKTEWIIKRRTVHGMYGTYEQEYRECIQTGDVYFPENDRLDNMVPACHKCNILKSSGGVEDLRAALAYFCRSIPEIKTYSHVHHLMRFGKLSIDSSPVVFWFEQYKQALVP
jgi:hypothetical protein